MWEKKLNATPVLKMNKLVSQEKFILQYNELYNTSKDKIKQQVRLLKETFTVRYSTLGPIIYTALWNKSPKFCWGNYFILLNIYDLNKCMAIGGRKKICFRHEKDFAIHPNIHTDLYVEKKYGHKVCFGRRLTEVVKTCLSSGELVLACEELISMLNRTGSSDELFGYWGTYGDSKDSLYSKCTNCSRALDVGQRLCDQCSKSE